MAHFESDDSLLIPEDVLYFCKKIGYPVISTKSQRITGPIAGKSAPVHGTEIFVSNMPKTLREDYLIPYFQQTGEIYKFRLMMTSSEYSRGSAFITYNTLECAHNSMKFFNGREIYLGQTIVAEKSRDNRRLFLGGIPDTKSRDEVWHELKKMGMKGIVDVIMYRSYSDRNRNRGFVFVEFNSHQDAAQAKFSYKDSIIFGQRVSVDWSSPMNDVDDVLMSKVKILFLRNLNVSQERDEFVDLLRTVLVGLHTVDKIYKFRDYAFVHFKTRRDAQKAMWELKNYYKSVSMDVEVEWSKPPPKNRKTQQSSKPADANNENTRLSTRCNCICKHSVLNSEPDSSEISPQSSLLLNNDFNLNVQNTPIWRAPFHNLTNNVPRSQVPSPLFSPQSSYCHSSLTRDAPSSRVPSPLFSPQSSFSHSSPPRDMNTNLQSPSTFLEGPSSISSLWQLDLELPH